ncbi:alginate O-acetyltransferase AlgF [Shimia sp. R10_1]|uniref:alginate O-acetyltransferase AlgF n=1 Tax=Shimia sp. R10_1 TaxID=2821095 RepID=UPI001ADD414B|nr:alginate O-acetyltransferase AlgF [Shimia sp. R10_1]MBO9475746.1 alginate O-acetyltransferase AlgF [Shimia sp. R10_1]
MDRSVRVCLRAVTAIFAASAALAADNELYDAPPPDDAAFIRWIEPDHAPEVLGVRSLGAAGDVFHPVSAAKTDGAQAGVYYTVARDALGQVVVIEEPKRVDRSKVLLTLVNLSESPVRLIVPDQHVEVVGSTPPNTAGGRAVNPVTASVAVWSERSGVLGRFELQLRRGQNVTLVARPESAELIENQFGANLGG